MRQRLNDAGKVVGWSYLDGNITNHATIWDGTTAIDLNTLLDSRGTGWVLEQATGINSIGQIVGIGRNAPNYPHAFLLTPKSCVIKADDEGRVRCEHHDQ